ncbi:uncharacterized protein [Diadema antillarum]|uniref:uncharacterized protein n=1 Tax=Diadema antillarum TaxID=105358 RepID=UPI003A83D1B9
MRITMSSYAGLDEQGLRKLLDTSSDITERRKIRAALRELRANNNNNVAHPHYHNPVSPGSKVSHHQSFRYERRRRPENDEQTKKQSQDDDILYRSRRKRETDGGGGGEDNENEDKIDINAKISEAGSDEQKLTKLLSETRDFNDRRKVRSAIREVKRKNRQGELLNHDYFELLYLLHM